MSADTQTGLHLMVRDPYEETFRQHLFLHEQADRFDKVFIIQGNHENFSNGVACHWLQLPSPNCSRMYLGLVLVHGLQTGKEQRGRTGCIAEGLDKARDGNDRHVLIQWTSTSRSQLHPEGLGHGGLGLNHGLEM